MASESNVSGDDEHVFASFDGPDQFNYAEGNLEGLGSMGEYFVYYRRLFSPFGNLEIYISDGVQEGTPYLVPPAGSDYFAPAFADTHVIWLRGLNQDLSTQAFEQVEVWASPFSADAASLVPEKIGDTSLEYQTSGVVGGWGRYALRLTKTSADVWNASTHEVVRLDVRAYGSLWHALGLSRNHLYVTTDLDGLNTGDDLLRLRVE
jgi:hypothetical protein